MLSIYTKSKTKVIIEEFFFRSWWVILCLIFCLTVYERDKSHKKKQFEALSAQLKELNIRNDKYLEKQNALLLLINSQSDPRYVEVTLMKVLGVVPEGQKKFVFVDKSQPRHQPVQ